MTEVVRSQVVDAPVARVWAVVRDFDALPNWVPAVKSSRIEGGRPGDRIGCVRLFTMRDGGELRERLLGLDDRAYVQRYEILESDMAVENYVARLELLPVSDGDRTYAQWSAEFDCEQADEAALTRQIGDGVFAAALDALRKRFG